jgi:hypothetical protein
MGSWYFRPLVAGGIAVDRAHFEIWLGSIGELTEEQRSDAFQALALAEAALAVPIAATSSSRVSDAAMPASARAIASGPASGTETGAGNAAVSAPISVPCPLAAATEARIEQTGCPHCGSRKLQGWGHVSGLPRYRCTECRRSFNALTGTPLARLRKKELWAEQAQALITGEAHPGFRGGEMAWKP